MHTQFQHLLLTKKDRTGRSEKKKKWKKDNSMEKKRELDRRDESYKKKPSKKYNYVLTCLQRKAVINKICK